METKESHELLMQKIEEIQKDTDKKIAGLATSMLEIKSDIAPVIKILTNANGFTDVLIVIVKIFGSITVIIGGVYALVELFKRLGK